MEWKLENISIQSNYCDVNLHNYYDVNFYPKLVEVVLILQSHNETFVTISVAQYYSDEYGYLVLYL
jgi:hypothetical protein